ncbi:OSCP, subunit 5 of the stator stalk of mitochondrial F1F0 ATP synthase [Thelephora ganbajun]|uniref:OSCP, subunit 5 of the stator stalk of mitochondrial F1F0 ATP synthase n=1 Tax=Thelephora ganbajun TaxID=370292 RepID=A0ACB6ZUJ5_THEGA|nr:OSCP, subunit 5 of the stator stalk of mitochondrial F1F0 ATP synthase [Thelephora ganbajun]
MLASNSSRLLANSLGRRAASTIAPKYSQAVFSAALAKSPATLARVETELNALSDAIKASPELNSFVTNPTLSAKDRASGLTALYAKAEGAKKEPVSEITKNLFALLSENGRLAETQSVVEGFNELVSKHKGELKVVISSVAPLPAATLSRLETVLKQSQAAQKAKTLKVTNKVNPSLLGGLVVDFGDKTIDLSVSSRVGKLNNLLQESV